MHINYHSFFITVRCFSPTPFHRGVICWVDERHQQIDLWPTE